MDADLRPFHIAVPDAVLDDLHARLRATRPDRRDCRGFAVAAG